VGDVGRKARDAAVMRRHEHVAGLGIRGHEPGQPVPLDVAGEQQPAARRLDGKHDARLVIVGTAFVLVEHPDPTERIGGDLVAHRERAYRNPAFVDLPQQFPDGQRVAPQEGPGDSNLAERKPLQQVRHGIEVVGVGMGEDECVDPGDRAAPEDGGHPTAGGSWRPEPAGVVDEHPAAGAADDDPAAMPHGRHDDLERLRTGACHRDTDPTQAAPGRRRQDPGRRPAEGLAGQAEEHQARSGIPADRPPERWSWNPGISSRHGGCGIHDRFDRPEDEIAEAAEESGEE